MNEVKRVPKIYSKVGYPSVQGGGKRGDPPTISSMTEIITVAAVHEFGAPKRNIPERSFIRTAFDDNIEELNKRKTIEYQKVLKGKQSAEIAIGRVGEFLVNETKNKIREGLLPALKYREGTPLWDTGQLINTIQHVETENKA
jgi:phage gpG-like protein